MLLDSDRTRLQHMIDAAREAVEFVQGVSRPALDRNRQLQHSLVRCIEIIGEAASRLSPAFREEHANIPWLDVVGMRNRLIHAYFDVDMDVIWRTSTQELPALLVKLEQIRE